MKRPRLPSSPDETWDGGFVLSPVQPVRDVSGAGGMIFGGGDALVMLRPGGEQWKGRPAPEDLGPVLAVAVEQGPPWRYAVSSALGITLYGLPNDQMLTLRAPDDAGSQATHMAWAAFGEERVLYLRWDDGGVARVRLDLGTIEDLAFLPMDAIASDVNGVLAMVSLGVGAADAHAIFTRDGVRFEERPAAFVPVDGARVHLAVADAAIAYAVEGKGAHVSRGIDDDFAPVEVLAGAGPIAFHGSTADSALFGAVWSKDVCAIDRVDANGEVQRIAEIGANDAAAPRIAAMVWDRSRRALWAASPQAGILKSEEPRGKGKKRPSLN